MLIEFYVPTNHNQQRFEKRFGKFANFTPPRLRGRILRFKPDAALNALWKRAGDYDSDDVAVVWPAHIQAAWKNFYPGRAY